MCPYIFDIFCGFLWIFATFLAHRYECMQIYLSGFEAMSVPFWCYFGATPLYDEAKLSKTTNISILYDDNPKSTPKIRRFFFFLFFLREFL